MSSSPTRLTFLPRHLLFNESNIQSLNLCGRKSNLVLDDCPQQPFLAEELPGLGERGDFPDKRLQSVARMLDQSYGRILPKLPEARAARGCWGEELLPTWLDHCQVRHPYDDLLDCLEP